MRVEIFKGALGRGLRDSLLGRRGLAGTVEAEPENGVRECKLTCRSGCLGLRCAEERRELSLQRGEVILGTRESLRNALGDGAAP